MSLKFVSFVRFLLEIKRLMGPECVNISLMRAWGIGSHSLSGFNAQKAYDFVHWLGFVCY